MIQNIISTLLKKEETIWHEMYHAMGFYHEQTRSDRDEYVEICYDNIRDGFERNFRKESAERIDLQLTRYDYYSVMHYRDNGFIKDGGITIRTKDPFFQDIIGETEIELSPMDKYELQKIYGCSIGCDHAEECSGDNKICKNNVCQCENQYKFDENDNCVVVDGECENNSDCFSNVKGECVSNGIRKVCKCQSGFGVSCKDNICVAIPCDEDDCQAVHGDHSKCGANNLCECEDAYVKDGNGICVGEGCTEEDCSSDPNSECGEDDQCVCKPGHEDYDDGQGCVAETGGSTKVNCNNFGDGCFLDCTTNTCGRKLTTDLCVDKFCGGAQLRYRLRESYDEAKSHYCLRFDFIGGEDIQIFSKSFVDEDHINAKTIKESSDGARILGTNGVDLKASINDNNGRFKLLTVTVSLYQRSGGQATVENIKLMEGECNPARK